MTSLGEFAMKHFYGYEENKETLEEAAKNSDKSKCNHFRREHTKIEVYDSFEEGFIDGAKWQQEQVSKLRDELYNQLPTGEINAFDLLEIINNHIKKLDEL